MLLWFCRHAITNHVTLVCSPFWMTGFYYLNDGLLYILPVSKLVYVCM